MTFLTALSTLAQVAVAGGVGYLVYREVQSDQSPLPAKRPDRPARRNPEELTDPAPRIDPVITYPPQVASATGQSDSVHAWLRHHTRYPHITWDGVVATFYRRALADQEIAGYFHEVTDVRALQRHFTAAIILLTSDGLKARTDIRMAQVHQGVRDVHGHPITGAVYDRTVSILVGVLIEAGVPESAINDLAKTIEPLRRAIVTEQA